MERKHLSKQFSEVTCSFQRLTGAPLEAPMMIPEDIMGVLEKLPSPTILIPPMLRLPSLMYCATRAQTLTTNPLEVMHCDCTSAMGCIKEVISTELLYAKLVIYNFATNRRHYFGSVFRQTLYLHDDLIKTLSDWNCSYICIMLKPALVNLRK